MENDIRWMQRFSNYEKALKQLQQGIENNRDTTSDLIKEGIIQRFEFTHELAWKLMKDFLTEKGIKGIIGSKDATRQAFANELIDEGNTWMEMIESRNKTVHTYHANILAEEYDKIVKLYYPLFISFHLKMKTFL